MGNSQPVALGHYLQVHDDDYERAASEPTAIAVQNPVQSRAVPGVDNLHGVPARNGKPIALLQLEEPEQQSLNCGSHESSCPIGDPLRHHPRP